MPEGQSFPERLRALRKCSVGALAPLWIEQLPPEEALAELRTREGAVFRLQEARFLLELNRYREALAIVRELGDLPPGLASIGSELEARGEAAVLKSLTEDHSAAPSLAPSTAPDAWTETLARPEIKMPLEHALAAWLESVRGWRRALGV